jgi:hypothetical protein
VRIAYLVKGCGTSGGLAVVCQHANRLAARGHQVWIVSESGERAIPWFPRQGVPVVGLADYPQAVDALVATFWSTSFRVAHLPAQARFYFVQSDETRFQPSGSLREHLVRASYLLGFNYLTEARWIRRWLRDELGQDAELVPNGLDEALFHPAPPLTPRGARPRVLLEGSIDVPFKGMA